MYRRFCENLLLQSLSDTPVTVLVGARQTGKTTLVKGLTNGPHPARYVTLDDLSVLSAATSDPVGFISAMRVLFPVIKQSVDRERTPGRFLLTGSANTLLLPKVAESLAGRMEIITLWPLSQAEINGAGDYLIDLLFADEPKFPVVSLQTKPDMVDRILASGYPEPLARTNEARRQAWFRSDLSSILQRDVRDLANITGLTEMPRLLAVLASRMASLLNLADVSRSTGIPYTSLNRYMSLLQAVFLIQLLPAWTANIGIRLTHSPKLLINDTGLSASFIGLNKERLQIDGSLLGHLVENFVALELIKAIELSNVRPSPFHYHTSGGVEVDLVLESPDGRLIAIEVKASSTVNSKDFRGIRSFAEATRDRFVRGFVFYSGDEIVPFSEKLFAIPISILWSLPSAHV
jgi:predicted AAA+ superfamily ATPase